MKTSAFERADVETAGKVRMRRKWSVIAWAASVAFLVLLWSFPIRTGLVRMAILLCAVLVWTGALVLWRRKPLVVALLGSLGLLVAAAALLPGRPADAALLRTRYGDVLNGYADTTYVWGGETHRGIDCSGLVRCSLAQAAFEQGLRTRNPRLLREGFALWWNDSSADNLKDGYGGRATRLFEAGALNDIPAGDLEPGDFAVTADGSHTLVYLGDGRWTAADPDRGGVVLYRVPEPKEHYFRTGMVLMRWRILDMPH